MSKQEINPKLSTRPQTQSASMADLVPASGLTQDVLATDDEQGEINVCLPNSI